jgi:5-methylthioadenosine/S-adenosylhomocysteine deaminase
MADYEDDDPVKRIVSAFQSDSVRHSVIDGRLVMEDRELLTMDEAEIMEDARKAWRFIRSQALG